MLSGGVELSVEWSVEYNMKCVLDKIGLCIFVFRAPEPKVQVHYCDHAMSIVRRPSVRR